MQRITDNDLKVLCTRLNKLTGSPEAHFTDGKINVGNFHIISAYGGVKLARTVNDKGGVISVLDTGYVSKRELYYMMRAFIAGIEFVKGY